MGRLEQLRQDLVPLRLAVADAYQHEPHVVMTLDEPVGVDDAERVVRSCERADLHQQRFVAGHAQRREDLADVPRR